MTEAKLTYFNGKGLAEQIRYLLSYGGVKFVDDSFEDDEWPKLKPSMPFGLVPVLEFEGKRFNQSIAIARYLGKKFGLAGANDYENYEIDMIVDTLVDFRAKTAAYKYEQNKEAKEEKKSSFQEVVPFFLEKLNAIAQENNGHLALKKLTWADFVFAGTLEYLNYLVEFDITAKYPGLKAVNDYVENIPAVKSWIEKRPKTDY